MTAMKTDFNATDIRAGLNALAKGISQVRKDNTGAPIQAILDPACARALTFEPSTTVRRVTLTVSSPEHVALLKDANIWRSCYELLWYPTDWLVVQCVDPDSKSELGALGFDVPGTPSFPLDEEIHPVLLSAPRLRLPPPESISELHEHVDQKAFTDLPAANPRIPTLHIHAPEWQASLLNELSLARIAFLHSSYYSSMNCEKLKCVHETWNAHIHRALAIEAYLNTPLAALETNLKSTDSYNGSRKKLMKKIITAVWKCEIL
ncbi:hypothetical protein CPC08DRAFT_724109 [Agrocybe pediades]|nr:hypothetical protein CPC08DRAFT_724109 [Agrocybe pediades]